MASGDLAIEGANNLESQDLYSSSLPFSSGGTASVGGKSSSGKKRRKAESTASGDLEAVNALVMSMKGAKHNALEYISKTCYFEVRKMMVLLRNIRFVWLPEETFRIRKRTMRHTPRLAREKRLCYYCL